MNAQKMNSFTKVPELGRSPTLTFGSRLAPNALINEGGYLEIVLGPMFSGKTTRLIQAYKKYKYIGKQVVVINYAEDTRYDATMLSTHDKIMIPCIQSKTMSEIWYDTSHSSHAQLKNADVILINEGQFFQDLYDIVLEMVDVYSKRVYICGLDGDFQRNKFGRVLDLIPRCDKVDKLHSLCSKCRNGTEAIFSHRITTESSQIVIGSDNYIPLCRNCYVRENSTGLDRACV